MLYLVVQDDRPSYNNFTAIEYGNCYFTNPFLPRPLH